MKSIFIAGTGTGVGKTVVAGCLAHFLAKKGHTVITQKWVQTGSKNFFSCDVHTHLRLMGKDKKDVVAYQDVMMPYLFPFAASPHLASRLDGRAIDPEKIKRAFKGLSLLFDYVVVEGTGGLLAPFNKKSFLIDIVKDLKIPVLLISDNKLGAINHTCLALEALRHRKMKILGVVCNNAHQCDRRIRDDNPRIIKSLSKEIVFGILSREKTQERLYRRFVPIAEKIYRYI